MFFRLHKSIVRFLVFLILISIIVLLFKHLPYLNLNENQILKTIEKLNRQQIIYNKDKFNEFNNDSVIIVIQVHDRILYLAALIESLRYAKDISKTLLIFSHDYFDENINKLVKEINFCKVMQIFYPYSIQIYPNAFPGTHPNDCARDIKKAKPVLSNNRAIKIGCNNAFYHDKYGHYREAKYVQIKHHWWWKVNRIFNELEVTKNYNGYLIFLEEDYYVTKDFVDIFYYLKNESSLNCPDCNVLTLGRELLNISSSIDNGVIKTQFTNNIGFAFNRSTWNDISQCDYSFCSYDDYNWDFTLIYVSNNCLKNKLYSLTVKETRVYHIGICGAHHNQSLCTPNNQLNSLKAVLNRKSYDNQKYSTQNIIKVDQTPQKALNENGGWGDKRDIELCMKISALSKKILNL